MNSKLELAKSVWLQVEPNRLQNKRNAREKLRINPGLKFSETRVMIVTDIFATNMMLATSVTNIDTAIPCPAFKNNMFNIYQF